MKKLIITVAVVSLSLSNCGEKKKEAEGVTEPATTNVKSVDSAAVITPEAANINPPVDSATMAKAWENYMTPGDMHRWLAQSEGKWDADFTFWSNPGAKAETGTQMKVETRMILGGRYQESVYKGKVNGMDFEGRGISGYDNSRKKFVSTWVDNFGTGLMYMEGNFDVHLKTLTTKGKTADMVTGAEKPVREVLTIVDDKHQVMEMYDTKNGEEYKSMEIKLKKK
jgi:hypothetical protein